ncbi:uncharacterized protein LOC129916982 [Episyrphus balteatus]|uniref:uncharacterized protein LOC129916982 n=1 Tax=Episyrphus balteatus TaxID=286459 RepID=UPI002485280A|nr:uncharacterized protein LOC129916982 [Episyrphus balteatus]
MHDVQTCVTFKNSDSFQIPPEDNNYCPVNNSKDLSQNNKINYHTQRLVLFFNLQVVICKSNYTKLLHNNHILSCTENDELKNKKKRYNRPEKRGREQAKLNNKEKYFYNQEKEGKENEENPPAQPSASDIVAPRNYLFGLTEGFFLCCEKLAYKDVIPAPPRAYPRNSSQWQQLQSEKEQHQKHAFSTLVHSKCTCTENCTLQQGDYLLVISFMTNELLFCNNNKNELEKKKK